MLNSKNQKVLVTGASGFVGSALVERLINDGYELIVISRKSKSFVGSKLVNFIIPDLNPTTDYSVLLDGVSTIVHLAARVHLIDEAGTEILTKYRSVNLDSTLNLAKQAAVHGVKRFVYISSIKVNGESTSGEDRFFADDEPKPESPYGISKLEAELSLKVVSEDTGMEVVIIRPPLVYGPKVKANFASMMNWLSIGIPLPFGSIKNSRSLVALDNLVDLILTCIVHPKAANQIFLVSDDHDISTTMLLKSISMAFNKRSRLIPIPVFILRAFFFLVGRKNLSQRLLGSLRVDITKTKELLDWMPAVTFEEGIRRTAKDFLNDSRVNK